MLTSLLEFEDKKDVLIRRLIIEITTTNKYFGKLQVASKRGTFHFKPKVQLCIQRLRSSPRFMHYVCCTSLGHEGCHALRPAEMRK